MFEKTLSDLVKGIRSNKANEDQFIRGAIQEIKNELKTTDLRKKALALQKLTYLHMMGYSMEWAAFNVLEVMSDKQFALKRIGYLAAAQCYTPTTDVIMLATQTMRKDLKSANQYEAGLAISGLSSICTPDLARDLATEVVGLTNSQRPYIRKKAVLVMFKIFLQYPDALRPSFPALKEKLVDSHPSVVSCAVNVICELARKNPKNYLGMAPVFFKLMTTLNNNWTVIKIVKLFGALAPHEPRLAKKLVEPLANMINTTPAKSLLYECLCTVTKGMSKNLSIVKLAAEKLKMFVQDADQNLKYLGLLGLNNLMADYPKIIGDLKDEILNCLEDEDITIRYRALDLLCGVVNKKNIVSIVSRLLKYAQKSDGEYKNFLIEKIITTCSKDTYANIANFKWYIQILADLTELKGIEHGKLIAAQFMDILIRVKSIRSFGISEMVKLLTSSHIINESAETSNIFEVLHAAAWLVGEFISESKEDSKQVLDGLLQPRLSSLPPRIQAVYVQSIIKLYAAMAASKKLEQKQDPQAEAQSTLESLDQLDSDASSSQQQQNVLSKGDKLKKLTVMREAIRKGFDSYLKTSDVEVQERVVTCLKLLTIHEDHLQLGNDIGDQLSNLFEEALNPVAPKVQQMIPIPEGLDLDKWINEPFESDIESLADSWENDGDSRQVSIDNNGGSEHESNGDNGSSEIVAAAMSKQNNGPQSDTYEQAKQTFLLSGKAKNDPSIETKSLESLLGTNAPVPPKKKAVKGTTARKKLAKRAAEIEEPVEIMKETEVPDFAKKVNEKASVPVATTASQQHADRLSQIDLTGPLAPEEHLYQPQAYPTAMEQLQRAREKEEQAKRLKDSKKTATTTTAATGTKKKATGTKTKKASATGTKTKKASATGAKKAAATQGGSDDLIDFLNDDTTKSTTPIQPAPTTTTSAKSPAKKKSTTGAAKKKKVVKRKLCQDETLSVSYNPYVMPIDDKHIAIPLYFENVSDNVTISNIDFDIESTLAVKLLKDKQGPLRMAASVAPSESATGSIKLQFSTIEKAHTIYGRVDYSDGAKKRIDFSLVLPSSMFIEPRQITTEEFTTLLKGQAVAHKSATKCSLPALKGKVTDINGAAKEIASLLRLTVVEKLADTAYSMYGQSAQKHHVALLVKSTSADSVTVELRCSNEALGTSLLGEVHRLFKK